MRRVCLLILSAIGFLLPSEPARAGYSALYALGDSMSDINSQSITNDLRYDHGRYSNGKVWVEYLADRLSIPSTNTFNLAVAGATSAELDAQVSQVPASESLNSALITVWIGGEDLLANVGIGENEGAWNALVEGAVNNISNNVVTLYGRGARSILVVNQNDLAFIPYMFRNAQPSSRTYLHNQVVRFNSLLSGALFKLSVRYSQLTLYSLDAFAAWNDFTFKSNNYGFKRTDIGALWDPNLPSKAFTGPGAGYLYWDDRHPTTKTHAYFASLAATRLPVPPKITAQPTTKPTNAIGDTVSLRVTATGSNPLRFQWFKNNDPIAKATNAILNLAKIDFGAAGDYWVTVTNQAGSVTSSNVVLRVRQETVLPTVSITSHKANTRITNALITLAGTAIDNVALASVEYQFNGAAPQTAFGTNRWSAPLTLLPGSNSVTIVALDLAGNRSKPLTLSLTYTVVGTVQVALSGDGTYSPYLPAQLLDLGRSYTVTAKPAPGWLFFRWWVGDASSSFRPALTFVMQSNLVLQAEFLPNTFRKSRGTYGALFKVPGFSSLESMGALNISLTDAGKFTGKLLTAEKTFTLSGQFDPLGRVAFSLPRTGRAPLQVSLALATNGTGLVSGTVTEGTWSALLEGTRLSAFTKIAPAPQTGTLNLVLPGVTDATNSPAGDSVASLSIAPAGSILGKGSLADGTPLSLGGGLSTNGLCPIFLPLYAGKGALYGWVTLPATNTQPISGELVWIKSAAAAGKYYPAGFTNEISVVGSRFVAPPKNGTMLPYTNTLIHLAGGNVTALDLPAILTPAHTLNNGTQVDFKLAGGLLSGSFKLPGAPRAIPVVGVVLQQQQEVRGFFLGTNASGHVRIQAAVAP